MLTNYKLSLNKQFKTHFQPSQDTTTHFQQIKKTTSNPQSLSLYISTMSSRSTNSVLILLIVLMLISPITSYLQFKLNRIPKDNKKLKQQEFNCPESIAKISEQDYKEVCYDKDISYSFQIYQDGQLHMMSADLTTPISWIKGKDCLLKGSDNKCSLINGGISQKISGITKSIKNKLRHSKEKKEKESQREQQKVQIYGSSNVIQGYLQQPPHMVFTIMDSNRLTRLMDILLLGLFVLDEKDNLQLDSTKFINATMLTPKLNYVSDGAISLRFDQNSENSFLNEIFAYTKAEEKIATLYLGEKSYLAIGELSLKFSEHGYSGINWVTIQQDENFGKVPTISEIILQDTQHQIDKKMSVNKPAILTLSASYIGMHVTMTDKLTTKLSKTAKCQFQQHGYLKCTYSKKSDRDRDLGKRLTFSFGESSISLDFNQLVLHQESQLVIFNIKQLYQQDYLILGEPIFKKYTLYLDYGKEKIGFAIKRQHFQKQFINVVSLIRFLVFVFCVGMFFFVILGCCFILCSAPCRVVCSYCFGKNKVTKSRLPKDRLRLKEYSPVQQESGYEELSERIKTITTSRETTQVDGHPDDSI